VRKAQLSRQAMCDRLAMEFEDGWVVNLGAGIPQLCSNFDFGDKTILFHSENGVIGYGPEPAPGEEDLQLVDAGLRHTTLVRGAAIVDHADSFALIRAGYVSATVLGAYQVAESGDFANWKLPGRRGGGIGGAMDLAIGAQRVFIAMEHTGRQGELRLRTRCTLPITARGVVKLIVTNLGLFEVTQAGLLMREIAPSYTPEEVQALTEATLIVPPDLRPFRFDERREEAER